MNGELVLKREWVSSIMRDEEGAGIEYNER